MVSPCILLNPLNQYCLNINWSQQLFFNLHIRWHSRDFCYYPDFDSLHVQFPKLLRLKGIIDLFVSGIILNTNPVLLALQQMEGTGTLDARQEPHGMTTYQSLQQADITGRFLSAAVATRLSARLLQKSNTFNTLLLLIHTQVWNLTSI